MKVGFVGPGGTDRKSDRWNRDSEAGKLLRQLLENGEVDASDPPKIVWESYPIFQQYDLSKFRAALNKMKAELGCNIRTTKKDPDENNGGGIGASGYAIGGVGVSGDSTGNEEGSGYASNDEFDEEPNGWMPMHKVFQWLDAQFRDRVTVVVLMPSGVNRSGYHVEVGGGGRKLELTVQWPEMMVDSEKLHEPYRKMMEVKKGMLDPGKFQDYLNRQQQYQVHINELKRKMGGRLESKCAIKLPRNVIAHHIESSAYGVKEAGTRVLYVNLVCEYLDSSKQDGPDCFVI